MESTSVMEKDVLISASERPVFVDCTRPQEEIDLFRSRSVSSIASASRLFLESMPELVAQSPLKTGEFVERDDSAARQVLDVTPRDVGVVCVADSLGYYSGVVPPEKWNDGLISVGKLLPYVTVLSSRFEDWVGGRINGVDVGVVAYTFRNDSNKIMWSKNSGLAGLKDEIGGKLMLISQGMVGGSFVVIGRSGEEAEEWQGKIAVYSSVAQEIGFAFYATASWVRFQKPILRLEGDTQTGFTTSGPRLLPAAERANFEASILARYQGSIPVADVTQRSVSPATKKLKFTRKRFRQTSPESS